MINTKNSFEPRTMGPRLFGPTSADFSVSYLSTLQDVFHDDREPPFLSQGKTSFCFLKIFLYYCIIFFRETKVVMSS